MKDLQTKLKDGVDLEVNQRVRNGVPSGLYKGGVDESVVSRLIVWTVKKMARDFYGVEPFDDDVAYDATISELSDRIVAEIRDQVESQAIDRLLRDD